MKITQLLILIITTSLNTVSAQNTSKDDNKQSTNKSYLELPKIKVIPIQDTGNDRAYELYVKLPEKYSESPDVNYPVIYYTDAMWHVEMLSGAAEYIMEDAILVGISWQKDNKEELVKERGEHVSRFRDYSVRPSTNANHQAKYEFGQASAHLDFIRKDVIPYVENNYRTDPNKRTYFGYSLGGVFGAYTLLSHPNTFKNYILGSPALDGDIPYITELDANTRSKQNGLNANVFISYGSLERELSQYADEFITLLKNRNDPSLELKHVVIEGSHQTAFPATAVQGVTWLTQITSFPVLDGQYFGQKEPGLTPEVFAPGVVSIDGRFEGAISFSPDLKEMYFGANDENEETHIYFSKLEGTQWTPIKRVNFTKAKKDEELHPLVSQDGRRVYFTVDDPDLKEPKIWYVNRLDDSWSEARPLDSPLNDDKVFFPNQSKNGDLYYFNLSKMKTYYALNKNGEFPEVQEVDIEFGHHAFISPSQDYLVMTTRNKEEGRNDNDVFVCFKQKDGSWTKAINLGNAVNSTLNEKSPSITPDGKYLFFGRAEREGEIGLSNIHWVSTEVINNLRPENL